MWFASHDSVAEVFPRKEPLFLGRARYPVPYEVDFRIDDIGAKPDRTLLDAGISASTVVALLLQTGRSESFSERSQWPESMPRATRPEWSSDPEPEYRPDSSVCFR